MSLVDTWVGHGGDKCGAFFETALRAYAPPLPLTATVLEIGCAEYDWIALARRSWPAMQIHGIDWRGRTGTDPLVRKGNVLTTEYDLWSFDWIVSISAIEHIGLGHYENDPVDADGDRRTMERAYTWLKPGGWLYCDVPWDLQYHVVKTNHRCYDDAAVTSRLLTMPWRERWRGYVSYPEMTTLLPGCPTAPCPKKMYCIGLWLQKPC